LIASLPYIHFAASSPQAKYALQIPQMTQDVFNMDFPLFPMRGAVVWQIRTFTPATKPPTAGKRPCVDQRITMTYPFAGTVFSVEEVFESFEWAKPITTPPSSHSARWGKSLLRPKKIEWDSFAIQSA
jgi:hypothetical protein